MKKMIYVSIALLSFVFGFGIYYIYPLIVPISLAELRQNIEYYESRRFKVFGKLEVIKFEDTSGYLINLKDYENDCSGEPMCFRGLELSEDIKTENISLIDELAVKNKTFGVTNFISGDYLAEVEITGELVEQKEKNPFCNCMIYNIKVEKMKQVSPIKFVTVEEMGGR